MERAKKENIQIKFFFTSKNELYYQKEHNILPSTRCAQKSRARVHIQNL